MEWTTAFNRYVVQGGVMMLALVPCLVLMVAYVIQASLNLRRARVAPVDFLKALELVRKERGIEGAREYLAGLDHSLAEVIRAVDSHLLLKRDADPAEALREAIEAECDQLAEANSQLAVIYRIAPQMGLLGTVFGMIQTFNTFAQAANPDVRQLSVGINVALITTAWGLSIAIPAYLVYYLVQRKVAYYEQILLPREGSRALHLLLHDRTVGGPDA